MSRKLKTASTVTDIQLEPGQIIKTGIAYWDPFYDEEIGWTAINHYVTGCASQWIDLELYSESTTSTTDNGADGDNDSGGVTMKLSALAAAATLFLLN